jgi:hypothetical protein
VETRIDQLLQAGRFEDARVLLQRQLASGELIDPRTDTLWAPIADLIAAGIEAASGRAAITEFWRGLLGFFLKEIEPAWGHAHKGHLYFRLGMALVGENLAAARGELKAAYDEDLLLAGETPERAQVQSSYVALAIIEQINDAQFSSDAEKENFIRGLFSAFDAAIYGVTVPPERVATALATIVPPPGRSACEALNRELRDARGPFATVSITGSLLEAVLLGDLYHRKGVRQNADGRDILSVELGPLLQEAERQRTFPSDSIRVACRLVHIFRNRLHPGNELGQTYKLVPRVATTIRVSFELALVEWAEVLRIGS